LREDVESANEEKEHAEQKHATLLERVNGLSATLGERLKSNAVCPWSASQSMLTPTGRDIPSQHSDRGAAGAKLCSGGRKQGPRGIGGQDKGAQRAAVQRNRRASRPGEHIAAELGQGERRAHHPRGASAGRVRVGKADHAGLGGARHGRAISARDSKREGSRAGAPAGYNERGPRQGSFGPRQPLPNCRWSAARIAGRPRR
jgi:hypothetical protein